LSVCARTAIVGKIEHIEADRNKLRELG